MYPAIGRGERGPAQGCKTKRAGLPAPDGDGQPGVSGAVAPGVLGTAGGRAWAALPGSWCSGWGACWDSQRR